VLVAVTRPAALAARRATTTIPIVFVLVPDPVASGLVESLARPGGNVTGLSQLALDFSAKRIELLKHAAPSISRVAVLVNLVLEGRKAALEMILAKAGAGIRSTRHGSAHDRRPPN
jgi:ABC-type uncharacterized transport system substrate-binding protein